jgi:hypothetical protein
MSADVRLMGVSSRRWLSVSLAALFVTLLASSVSAQLPARFYWKTLVGTNAVPVLGMSLSGNASPLDPAHTVLPDASVSATMVVAGYGKVLPVVGRSGLLAVLVPMGRVSGDVTLGALESNQDASGFGDPLVELAVNVIGPKPIRNIPDLLRYEPGFSLDLIADVAIPLGEYDNEQPLNIGQNRWYGRVGAPIVWQLGAWVPGRRTTLEFLPSLWLFGSNDDFVGRELETDPMFQVEGHVTRDLTSGLWAAFDATWITGGKSTIDGVEGEELNNIGVGFTLGYQINEHLQLTTGYLATVNASASDDLRLDNFRLSLVYGWHSLIEGIERLGEGQ